MKINLAIYTATEGFDWQPGSAYPRGELNKYKEMIGRFPDILMEKMPYGGIFVCDGKLVFYRLHIALRGDSRGRDALYCVLGTIPLEAGKKVNLSRVFETPEFRAPMRPFPNSVEIEESLPARPPSTWEEMQDALNSPSSSAQVGVLATFFGHGKFFCRLDGSVDNPTPRLTYENCDLKPTPKVEVRPPIEVARAEVAAQPNAAAIERNAYDRARSDFEKRLMAKELDNQRIESENQSLKNTVVILAVILSVLVVAGVGALLFSCCFSSSMKPVQSGVQTQKPVDPNLGRSNGQPNNESPERGNCDNGSGGCGQKAVAVVGNSKPFGQSVAGAQNASDEQVGEYVQPTMADDSPVNKANQEKNVHVQATGSFETNKPPVNGGAQKKEEARIQTNRTNGTCPECNGRGKIAGYDVCPTCNGEGWECHCRNCKGRDVGRDVISLYCESCRTRSIIVEGRCQTCKGHGDVKKQCKQCNGTGRIQ